MAQLCSAETTQRRPTKVVVTESQMATSTTRNKIDCQPPGIGARLARLATILSQLILECATRTRNAQDAFAGHVTATAVYVV